MSDRDQVNSSQSEDLYGPYDSGDFKSSSSFNIPADSYHPRAIILKMARIVISPLPIMSPTFSYLIKAFYKLTLKHSI